MRKAIFLLLLTTLSCGDGEKPSDLAQCMEDENYSQFSEETHAYFGDWVSNLYEPELQALSIHVHGEDEQDTMWRVKAKFNMRNYANHDCPMAIYYSESAPDLNEVTPISAESVLPESDENLGTLLYAANFYPGDGEEVWLDVQDYTNAMDFHLTWVTCENPRVHADGDTAHYSSSIGIEFEGCKEDYESPGGYSSSDSPEVPAGFSIDLSDI